MRCCNAESTASYGRDQIVNRPRSDQVVGAPLASSIKHASRTSGDNLCACFPASSPWGQGSSPRHFPNASCKRGTARALASSRRFLTLKPHQTLRPNPIITSRAQNCTRVWRRIAVSGKARQDPPSAAPTQAGQRCHASRCPPSGRPKAAMPRRLPPLPTAGVLREWFWPVTIQRFSPSPVPYLEIRAALPINRARQRLRPRK